MPSGSSSRPNPSRRQFLATTAAFGSAGLLASCAGPQKGDTAGEPFTKPKAIPVSEPRDPLGADDVIRMAVIGTGGMGTGHCDAITSLANADQEKVQIVALCDVNDLRVANAKKVCENAQGITVETTRNYHDILSRDDIHGVLIASPEHWHGTMARDALAAGKDVYCEKPMTLRLDDALLLREYVLANPHRIFQVGTQKMILPKWVEARRLIKEGAIGKPTFSQTSYCRNSKVGEWLYYGIDPAWDPDVNVDWDAWCGPAGQAAWDPHVYARWRRYRRWSTGIIGDLLVHQMTPLMMALDMGWPTRIVASGGHLVDKAMENHDQVNINAEFEGEHIMIVAGSTCNEKGLEVLIRGHHANLLLGSSNVNITPEAQYSEEIDPRVITCARIRDDQDQLRLNWLRCIRSRKPAVSGVDLATKMMVVVALATRSLWEGSAFEFDPKTLTTRKI